MLVTVLKVATKANEFFQKPTFVLTLLFISGASVSLSSNGSVLAVGGYSDTFGFTPIADILEGYLVTLKGFGATWIFQWNGKNYNQVDSKLVGAGYAGNASQQGEKLGPHLYPVLDGAIYL